MIQAAVYGTAYTDYEMKESKKGSKYATLLALTSNGADENGDKSSLMVKLLVFADHLEEAQSIKKDDRMQRHLHNWCLEFSEWTATRSKPQGAFLAQRLA